MKRRSFFEKLLVGNIIVYAFTSTNKILASPFYTLLKRFNNPFVLPPLGFAYDALEPSIDKLTMEIHHSKHHAAYIKNLNDELQKTNQNQFVSIENLCKNISKYNAKIRNNAGGHFNHTFFWESLSPQTSLPSATLMKSIVKDFGSFEIFKEQFEGSAKSLFGSGWTWLLLNDSNKLTIVNCANQDNPLMDVLELRGTPILGIDVWEHAYYLKYQNKRAEYIAAFWNVVNWKIVETRYLKAINK
jgi:Fe-Mn family superoxide dismutase